MARRGPAVFQGRGWGVLSGGRLGFDRRAPERRPVCADFTSGGAGDYPSLVSFARHNRVFHNQQHYQDNRIIAWRGVGLLFNACLFILGVLRTQEGKRFSVQPFFCFFGGGGGFGASTRGVFTGMGGMDGRGFRCVLIIARWFKREYFAACGAARVLRCICAAECLPA